MTARRKRARIFVALLVVAGISAGALAAPAGAGGASAEPQKKKKTPDEKDPQYQYEMGVVALRYGFPDEAVRYGKLAVSLDPEHFNGWNLLGSAYYTKGEFALAAEAYEKAAAIKPDAVEVQRNLGMALIELKETDKAEAVLKKAYALDGEAETAYQLGKLCYNGKRFDEGLDYALRSIQMDGKSAKAYNLKGALLNQMGRFAEAAGSFQAAIVLAPGDVGLQVNLGVAYLNSGEQGKAKAVFEAVLPKLEQDELKAQVENYLKAIKDGGK
mgnify:CR=1 FL=1